MIFSRIRLRESARGRNSRLTTNWHPCFRRLDGNPSYLATQAVPAPALVAALSTHRSFAGALAAARSAARSAFDSPPE